VASRARDIPQSTGVSKRARSQENRKGEGFEGRENIKKNWGRDCLTIKSDTSWNPALPPSRCPESDEEIKEKKEKEQKS